MAKDSAKACALANFFASPETTRTGECGANSRYAPPGSYVGLYIY